MKREASALSDEQREESKGIFYNFLIRSFYYLIMYFVYMIKNDFEKLYVGMTDNPNGRIIYHNTDRGARFTKGKAKFRMVFSEGYVTLTEARRREIQIKKWRREKKEMLIERYHKGLSTKL